MGVYHDLLSVRLIFLSHQSYMQVAKALFDGQLLDVYFTRSFYEHILGVKVTYHDIEAVDPDYYKNLKWMLEVRLINQFPPLVLLSGFSHSALEPMSPFEGLIRHSFLMVLFISERCE